MAEFQEVARHWKRMCKKYWTVTSCHGCPIAEHEREYEACSAYEADVVKMEELVMSWAAENPGPVYPTWWEWLVSIGAVTRKVTPDVAFELAETGLTDPIDPDTANKLGIEPKEV